MDIFQKLEKIFTKESISKEDFAKDGFRLLRMLSMKPEYTVSINRVQKYLGVLGYRITILLQYMFDSADKVPFLEFVKKDEKYKRYNEKSVEVLKKLFVISAKRLEEYSSNLWVTDEEIAEIWGLK